MTDVYGKTISIIDMNTNSVISTAPVKSVPVTSGRFAYPFPVINRYLPAANFSGDLILAAQFRDLSKNATTWRWDLEMELIQLNGTLYMHMEDQETKQLS